MAKAHFLAPAAPSASAKAVRLGTTGSPLNQNDVGKCVKLAAESQYNLCAAGDPIQGIVLSVETATSAGFAVGSVYEAGRAFAVADGLQATPGTGTLAVGDYVVTGTVVALNTALPSFPKVTKATNQPGVAVVSGLAGADTAAAVKVVLDAALASSAAASANGIFAWRVVSLYTAGTGAVGTTVVIERVNAATGVAA